MSPEPATLARRWIAAALALLLLGTLSVIARRWLVDGPPVALPAFREPDRRLEEQVLDLPRRTFDRWVRSPDAYAPLRLPRGWSSRSLGFPEENERWARLNLRQLADFRSALEEIALPSEEELFPDVRYGTPDAPSPEYRLARELERLALHRMISGDIAGAFECIETFFHWSDRDLRILATGSHPPWARSLQDIALFALERRVQGARLLLDLAASDGTHDEWRAVLDRLPGLRLSETASRALIALDTEALEVAVREEMGEGNRWGFHPERTRALAIERIEQQREMLRSGRWERVTEDIEHPPTTGFLAYLAGNPRGEQVVGRLFHDRLGRRGSILQSPSVHALQVEPLLLGAEAVLRIRIHRFTKSSGSGQEIPHDLPRNPFTGEPMRIAWEEGLLWFSDSTGAPDEPPGDFSRWWEGEAVPMPYDPTPSVWVFPLARR